MNPRQRALEIHRRLLDEYGKPVWREKLPPIDELVSTILSQNTNDDNRDVAFERLKETFPTWEEVMGAQTEDVIEAIRPAGLANQKGPRIQNVLRQIEDERGNLDLTFLQDMPVGEARDWLLKFKGVGPKTAAIVLLFALDMPDFPVDTHIYRLSGRLGLRPEKMSADKAHQQLAELFPSEDYYDAHLNLIRHGRQVCHARNPECDRCCLTDLCPFYEDIVQPS
ncbi:MAG: endonuclease III [Anaerolineales bacterium]